MNEITPEPRTCEVCGDPIRWDNRIGICQRNTECAKAYNRKKRSPAEPQYCEACGRRLNITNRLGLCSYSDLVHNEARIRKRYAANPEWRGTNFIDRTGERVGRLVVVRRAEDAPLPGPDAPPKARRRSRVRWLCICDCGKEKVASAGDLRSGRTSSCGCAKRTPHLTYRLKNPLPPGHVARNQVLASYRASAQRRGLAWELTDEQFEAIICQPCTYCGCAASNVTRSRSRSSTEFIWNGIDRRDSALGYISGNVLPCCSVCNNAKRDMSYDDFMAWIARLTEYHFFHPDVMPSRLIRKVQDSA